MTDRPRIKYKPGYTSRRTQENGVAETRSSNRRTRIAVATIGKPKIEISKSRLHMIAVATGLLAQRLGISPDRAWSLMVRLSQNGHVKVRDIAQAVIDAHCGRRDPIEVEILSSIEKHLPDGVRLVETREDGHRPIKEQG